MKRIVKVSLLVALGLALVVCGSFSVAHADTLVVSANHHTYRATLANNRATAALKRRLAQGPITVKAHDYEGMEKVGRLPWSLPRRDVNLHTRAGQIILYQGRQLSLYYGKNEWQLTPIAQIHHVSASQLKRDLGHGQVNIRYSLPR